MRRPIKILILTGAAIGLMLSPGCKRYEVEVTLNEDGSGSRRVALHAETIGEEGLEMELGELRQLFGLDEKSGWTMRREAKETEESTEPDVYVFTLDRAAKDISSWRAMSGDIDIRGTLEKGPLEKVFFHNEIEVERSEGNAIVYRETLSWNDLKVNLVDMNAAFYSESAAREYPFLEKQDVEMMRNFLAGMAMVAWYVEEAADDEIEDEVYSQVAGEYITYKIAERYPGKDLSGLPASLDRIINDEGDDYLDRLLKEKLPGAYLAGHTDIVFTVTMPGKIIETNATQVEGNTATWKYDQLLAPFNHPVELYIKAELAE